MGRISKAVYIPETWYHYRKGESYTSSYKADLPQKWNILYQKIKEEIQKQQLGNDFEQAYFIRISLGIIGLGLNEMFAKSSFKQKYLRIQGLLNRDIYREAIQKFPIQYFPIYWKMFFQLAKKNNSIGTMLMLLVIKKIIKR